MCVSEIQKVEVWDEFDWLIRNMLKVWGQLQCELLEGDI
jgi:hypothetical protein